MLAKKKVAHVWCQHSKLAAQSTPAMAPRCCYCGLKPRVLRLACIVACSVSDEAMDTIFFPDLERRGPHWMRLAGDCPSFIGISVICYDATDLHQSQLSENLGEGSS